MKDAQIPDVSIAVISRFLTEGSFEETLNALELAVERLERGQLSIDEAVDWYEIGLGLSHRCISLLERAELRISTIESTYGMPSGDVVGRTSDRS